MLASVLDARKKDFDVQVIEDASRPVNESDGREVLSKIQKSGAVISEPAVL